jgi:hypothetical protein
MASLVIERDELVVRLSQLEQLAAFRGDVHIPLGSVESVSAEKDPYSALRGVRAPGTGVPRMCAYGVRLMTGGRPDFAAVHGRGPAVRVELAPDAPFGRLLVSVDDPQAEVAALQARLRRARAA